MRVLLWMALGMAALAQTSPLVGRKAPELTGEQWLNSRVSLNERQGKVIVVHFWTFACINCKRNLPAYDRWFERFAPQGVVMIGVHTPELENEKDFRNVTAETKRLGIRYPVLFDPGYKNWERWQQHYWPTVYVIDKAGTVREAWIGELNSGGRQGEARIAAVIEKLLAE